MRGAVVEKEEIYSRKTGRGEAEHRKGLPEIALLLQPT